MSKQLDKHHLLVALFFDNRCSTGTKGEQETMPQAPTKYRAYLLRLWQGSAEGRGTTIWSASLEDPHTGERIGFATLDHLFAYILQQTEVSSHNTPRLTDE